MKYKVGQRVYLPSACDNTVEVSMVDSIMISTDKPGAGGPYSYSIDGWDTSYRLSNGLTVHENSLFGEPREAFDHIEQRATPASA